MCVCVGGGGGGGGGGRKVGKLGGIVEEVKKKHKRSAVYL